MTQDGIQLETQRLKIMSKSLLQQKIIIGQALKCQITM